MTDQHSSNHEAEQVAHPHYQQAVQQVKDHKFITLVVMSIAVALFLVFAAMALYGSSGAEQLDLSRPGYEDVRKKAQRDDTSDVSFSASGSLDEATYKDFERKYDGLLSRMKQQDAFSSDVLNPKTLQIDQDTAALNHTQ
jgi:hypothetical protein